ncbi:hypothetical protein MCETE4_00740 [Acidimicrobiia bacterium]
MSDPKNPETLIGEFPGQRLDPAPTFRIQSGGWLIHQKYLWIGEQGPGDADALHLSTREVITDSFEKRRSQPCPLKNRNHPRLVGI